MEIYDGTLKYLFMLVPELMKNNINIATITLEDTKSSDDDDENNANNLKFSIIFRLIHEFLFQLEFHSLFCIKETVL